MATPRVPKKLLASPTVSPEATDAGAAGRAGRRGASSRRSPPAAKTFNYDGTQWEDADWAMPTRVWSPEAGPRLVRSEVAALNDAFIAAVRRLEQTGMPVNAAMRQAQEIVSRRNTPYQQRVAQLQGLGSGQANVAPQAPAATAASPAAAAPAGPSVQEKVAAVRAALPRIPEKTFASWLQGQDPERLNYNYESLIDAAAPTKPGQPKPQQPVESRVDSSATAKADLPDPPAGMGVIPGVGDVVPPVRSTVDPSRSTMFVGGGAQYPPSTQQFLQGPIAVLPSSPTTQSVVSAGALPDLADIGPLPDPVTPTRTMAEIAQDISGKPAEAPTKGKKNKKQPTAAERNAEMVAGADPGQLQLQMADPAGTPATMRSELTVSSQGNQYAVPAGRAAGPASTPDTTAPAAATTAAPQPEPAAKPPWYERYGFDKPYAQSGAERGRRKLPDLAAAGIGYEATNLLGNPYTFIGWLTRENRRREDEQRNMLFPPQFRPDPSPTATPQQPGPPDDPFGRGLFYGQ